jgi:hypothetical protein
MATHLRDSQRSRRVAAPRSVRPLRAIPLIWLLAACNDVLDVKLPGRVREEALDNPALASTLVAGAQADFECAFTEFVHTTGLWSNELLNSSGGAEVNGWGARLSTYESGTGTCPTSPQTRGAFATYLPLQIARRQAEDALRRLDAFTDAQVANRALLLATAAAYSGYAHTLLGEAYCQMALDEGPLVTPAAVLAVAEQRFTRAIELATSANDTRILNLARVGRARVRLGLGKKAEAAADARLVPSGFVYNATYSNATFRRNNTVVLNVNTNFHESVAPEYRGLTVGTTPDPRVPVRDANRRGQDALTPLWTQAKYTSTDSPIPLATWDEAQLILAEAEGGQAAVDAINRVRAKYNLPAYAGGTAAQVMTQLVEERRRTLFLDGHAIGDHLRYQIPFATGVNQKGVRYGENSCLPLPQAETSGRAP